MSYNTSPVSIKKRKQETKHSNISSKAKDHTIDSNCNEDNKKPSANSLEIPVRTNGQISDSPQFSDFAESPEFRVGWDDGFETVNSCDKIKMDETQNNSKKKSRRQQVFVRTLRTQRILSTNFKAETVNCENEHPDSDEFLQWAESLLCAPAISANQSESSKNLNNSNLNQSINTGIDRQSPKLNDMKTPKRHMYNRSPSSDSAKRTNIYRSSRKKSYTSMGSDQDLTTTPFRKPQESPLARHSNGTSTSKFSFNKKCLNDQLKSPADSCSKNLETQKDEFNDFFNDSINELMVQCSQAVESKLNKENSDLKNLLDDSSNDLILQCTQQVEQKLMQQSLTNNNGQIKKSVESPSKDKRELVNSARDIHHKTLQNNSNVELKSNKSRGNSNTQKPFIPKKASNLHKLDSPNTIIFDDELPDNMVSSINKQLMNKRYNHNICSSPNSLRDSNNHTVLGSSRKTSNKHFLSPTTKDDSASRKKFCHNNNVLMANVNYEYAVTSSNQDFNSILNEDEDVLSNLDMDQVLSQVPPVQPITKPKLVSETNKCAQNTFELRGHEELSANNAKDAKKNIVFFNGFKPNPVKSAFDSGNKSINVQKNTSLAPMPDVIPKYTQEQIQMKKIEAKRRQALKLRERQKSFELK